MKKRFYLYISMLLAVTGTACNKMLDIKPVNSMIPVSVADYESVLMGGYPRTDFFLKTELLTDNVYANLSTSRAADKPLEPWFVWAANHLLDGTTDDPYWSQLYKTIFYANTVLDNFINRNPEPADRELFETVKGEAYAMRAFCYFYLVNLYADVYSSANLGLPGVPMPLTADDINKTTQNNKRETIGNVWKQIQDDLDQAAVLLAGKIGKNKYRFDINAVQLLRARVYLFTNQPEKAIQAASDVIAAKPLFNMNEMQKRIDEKGEYAAFSGNFGVIDSDYKNEILFYTGGKGNNNIFYYGNYMFKPSTELLALCQRPGMKDYRQYIFASFADLNTGDGAETGPTLYNMFAKQENPSYYIGLKLSEALMIRAECYARRSEKKKAIDDLNMLLQRRIKSTDFQPLTEASFADDAALLKRVLEERRVELAFDGGLRWFDLRRLGKPRLEHIYKNGVVYELKQNDPKYILQIPMSEQNNSPEMPLNPR
ncbi:RagB/SusD family nutrient uptake outer membrane protein [Pseudoflavitalea sp. G-6-1-2]|uniref:RagB/SusD family nutrient uptake outer membrane protein n=1 Tax=Pseudoflavitalea sp. G-6-1-2 TaxID=2728841 RepID=UPI00146B0135|nr:RagB/SusD family nutrient uptake outer membrane protein [Pseudoflavitalea sp. G-6-1-2]NML22997.1 RagB/SusD family nutrient uptake outer membrane protein [Pseudoflavitalea sp. G-6-1-2]